MNKSEAAKDYRLKSYTRKILATKIFRTVICVLLCILSLIPFYLLIVNSTRTSTQITSGLSLIPGSNIATNWKNMMSLTNNLESNIFEGMLHSVMVTFPSTILTIYFSTMTAYGIFAYRFKARKFAWAFIMAVMMIPSQVTIIGFMKFMTNIHLIDSYIALIIPTIAAPAVVFFMRQYMQGAFSLEIIEAARIDGAGEFRTFNTIALPLMKPALATQAIFAFIASWNNLFTPSMILNSPSKYTLPMVVQQLNSESFRTDYGAVYMGLFLAIIPMVIIYLCLSRFIVAGVALGGVKE